MAKKRAKKTKAEPAVHNATFDCSTWTCEVRLQSPLPKKIRLWGFMTRFNNFVSPVTVVYRTLESARAAQPHYKGVELVQIDGIIKEVK